MAKANKTERLEGNVFFRSMEIDTRGLKDDEREVEVSFSSETDKVKRWYGTEILSHRAGAVDLSRLKVGAHLFNHDPDAIIGPIKDAWLDEGEGRGKAIVGYDDTDEGNRAFKRTKSKSLRGISVGYIPLKALALEEGQKWEGATKTYERKGGEEPVYIITRWAPLEISSTPIPADPDVGIGRNNGGTLEGVQIETIGVQQQEETEMEKAQVLEAVREALQEMPKGVTVADVEAIVARAIQQKASNITISLEQYKELMARADAISPQAVTAFNAMVCDGKDYIAIQTELLRQATGKADASGRTAPAGDGTGRDAQKAGAVEIKNMSDDDFIRMITNPSYDLLQ